MNMGRVSYLFYLKLHQISFALINWRKSRNIWTREHFADSNKPEMLMYNLTGKIKFNAGFFRDMTFES